MITCDPVDFVSLYYTIIQYLFIYIRLVCHLQMIILLFWKCFITTDCGFVSLSKWFYFDIMFTFFHCSLFPFQSLFCDWIYYICTSVLMLSWYYPDIIFVSVIAFISHFIMVLFSFILNFLTMFLLVFHYQAALCTTVFCLFFFVLWFLFCFLL